MSCDCKVVNGKWLLCRECYKNILSEKAFVDAANYGEVKS